MLCVCYLLSYAMLVCMLPIACRSCALCLLSICLSFRLSGLLNAFVLFSCCLHIVRHVVCLPPSYCSLSSLTVLLVGWLIVSMLSYVSLSCCLLPVMHSAWNAMARCVHGGVSACLLVARLMLVYRYAIFCSYCFPLDYLPILLAVLGQAYFFAPWSTTIPFFTQERMTAYDNPKEAL